jgi:dipeptidyl aminopeptidase/acylaminoacyl peptidase
MTTVSTHARCSAPVLVAASLAAAAAALGLRVEARPLTPLDLASMDRLSSPAVSPDGARVAYVVRTTDLEGNRGRTDLWLVEIDGSPENGAPRRLTTHEATDSEPVWRPDGDALLFLSTRSGSSQVWELPLRGGEARQLTDLPLDVANLLVSPDGRTLAFTVEVFSDCADLACTTTRLERAGENGSGVAYDRLFVRHWDTWVDGRRSHLFTLPYPGPGAAAIAPVDVTAALDGDVPSKPFGGRDEIAFTPDGGGLVFAARVAPSGAPGADPHTEALSTNFDLYLAPTDGSEPPRNLTADNPAWDTQPVFSPDGKSLVYLAMSKAGYESDRFRLMLRPWPRGEARELAASWDRSVGGFVFAPDGRTVYATAQDVGKTSLFAIDVATGGVRTLVAGGTVESPQVAGDRIVFARNHLKGPSQLFVIAVGGVDAEGGDERQLTRLNEERLRELSFGDYEQFSFAGWNGETVYGYAVEPAELRPGAKAPVAFIIHGGPQGSSSDNFHYRWNPQVFAGAGYAVVMVDFHGSTGYGQAFTDSIRGDWGGKPLEDLQQGLAAALERFPYLDGSRVCALGASYGGYMINWIAGNWPERFRCLVNHDGLFDHRSMYYSTEELWFPEWDHGGAYHANQEGHERHNPSRFVERWQTPMLVIHGELDFRVPLEQGLATFTALQRRGVPSRFVRFPDENHWVLKPRNSLQWHDEVLGWLGRWLESQGSTGAVLPR